MELESGLPFKFYFENKDSYNRILPNNLSKEELEEYNQLANENYNWDTHLQNRKTNKLINSFFNWIRDNNLISENIEDDNLIYLCEAFTPVSFYEDELVKNMSSDVYDAIKNNKMRILFNWFAEPLYDEHFNQFIQNLCEKYKLDITNFYVLTSANNIKNTSNINYISDHFFLKTSAEFLKYYLQNKIFKPNSFDYVCEIVNQDIFQSKKENHFLCLNRSVDRPHRYAFGLFLEKYNLWNKGIFSFLVCDNHKQNDALIEVFNQSTAEEYSKYRIPFHSKMPLEIDTKFLINNNRLNDFGTSNIYYKPIYEKTAINIVTETTFKKNTVFISEKTFHPIINLQPFIMFASNGQLQELRNLGFKTFGHVIDESYDDEEDNYIRFKKVCNEILRLSEMSIDEINQLFLSCKDICIYNRNHLLSFTKYDVFENSLQQIKKIWNSKEKQF